MSLLLLLALLPVPAVSQTKGRRTNSGRRRAPAARATAKLSDEVRIARTRVADEIKFLTRFLYLYARASTNIEAVDEAIRRGEASPKGVALVNTSKATARENLKSARERLDQLELYFRTTSEIEGYYARLAGVAASAASAEEKAAGNQFDLAGRALLDAVTRLTDVLLEMRS